MAIFVRGQPVRTAEPVVKVEARLEPGRHRFTLVVADERGNTSRPDEWMVEVSRLTPIDDIRPRGTTRSRKRNER